MIHHRPQRSRRQEAHDVEAGGRDGVDYEDPLEKHAPLAAGKERVNDRATLSDPVEPDSRVLILQALSGG